MSENTGYEGHWPPRPVRDVVEGQVVQFPAPVTGCILAGTVMAAPGALAGLTALIQLESGEYTWAWVHELSEKEHVEPHNPWRELWEEVIGTDCWNNNGCCRFCGMHFSENHNADCLFNRADTMMAEEVR